MQIAVNSNAAAVAVRYDQAPKLIASTIVRRMPVIGAGLVKYIVSQKISGQVLEVRTGTLRRSIFSRMFLEGLDAVLVVGADAKKAIYARVQEYGGVIRPTHSQNLAIPLDAARTAKGVARMSAREFIQNPEALGFEHAFVNRKKTAIMGATADGRYEPVFALKKEVRIPEHAYLRGGVDDRRSWILEQFGAAAAEGAAGQGGSGE